MDSKRIGFYNIRLFFESFSEDGKTTKLFLKLKKS